MPFYEYQCQACGHRLEVLQKISEAALRDCPQCGAAALKKLVSKSAFRLKGGGWYETDFKHGDKAKAGDKTGDGDKADAKAGDGRDGKSGGEKSGDAAAGKKADKSEKKSD